VGPERRVQLLRGFYETAGGVKVLLFFPYWKFLHLLLPFFSCFRFISGFYTHSRVSCCELGACWGPMVMNRGCYLKHGL
jgi:hypothetical protein